LRETLCIREPGLMLLTIKADKLLAGEVD